MAAFGIWPPDAGDAGQHAIISFDGTIIFQTSPAFIDNVVKGLTGLFELNFVAGKYDALNGDALFVAPLEGLDAVGLGPPSIDQVEIAVWDISVGGPVDHAFSCHLENK